MIRLKPLNNWSVLLNELVGRSWVYYQISGNVGDKMIAEGTFQLLREAGIKYSIFPDGLGECDGVLVSGGGNLGGLYDRDRDRGLLWGVCEHFGLRAVILPQSVTPGRVESFPGFVRVFVREHYSEKLVKDSVFCDDLSLFLSTVYDVGNGSGRGIFFRRDVEGIIGKVGGFVDPVMLTSSVEGYVRLAGGFESIVTDRLHFGIAGLLCRRSVLLCRNSYFKNLGVWEASLRDLGCKFDV